MGEAADNALKQLSKLESIGFVEFTTHLVRDVYRVIVESSMEQLRAYAEFVEKIAMTLSQYQESVAGANAAEETNIANSYIEEVLGLNPADPDIDLTDPEKLESMKQHFAGITIKDGNADKTLEEKVDANTHKLDMNDLRKFITAKLKEQAKISYNLIKTILEIGMQKVTMYDGSMAAKLTFHVDASDTYSKSSSDFDTKATSWGVHGSLTGRLGGIPSPSMAGAIMGSHLGGMVSGGYNSSKLSVHVVNEKSTAAVNVRADIIGEVRINFRTETFPAPAAG